MGMAVAKIVMVAAGIAVIAGVIWLEIAWQRAMREQQRRRAELE